MNPTLGKGKIITWIVGGAAIWSVALLLILQHLLFSNPTDRFEADQAVLNTALRNTIIQLGILPESRAVKESLENLGDKEGSWHALNWRIRLPESFDVPHARARIMAAIETAHAKPLVRWTPEDSELPLVIEAFIGKRLSHRLLFTPNAPQTAPQFILDAQAFLGTRWQLLSGKRLDLDRQLYSELSSLELNGPPLLIREFWQTPDQSPDKVPNWVISVRNGMSLPDAVSALRGRITLGRLENNYLPDGESIAIGVLLDGALSHRLIFTGFPDGRGINLKSVRGSNTVLLTPPRVAVIIDDMGFDVDMAERFMSIDGLKLTLSIIPYQPFSTEVSVRAQQHGVETMVHMPMEPNDYPANNPGRGAILVSLDDGQIVARTEEYLASLPTARGVNNHMGSRAMADSRVVRLVLGVIGKRNLYFIDSRTASDTLGLATASSLSIPAAERAVFIDEVGNSDVNYRLGMIRQLIRLARERGSAIGIGHPSVETLSALRIAAREFLEAGVEVVFASDIVS
jgi:polysaccharide deacetylase 2 family uncharacterized protein YibQ